MTYLIKEKNNNLDNINNYVASKHLKKYNVNDISKFLSGDNLIDGINSNLNDFILSFYNKENKNFKNNQKMFLGRISNKLSKIINYLLNSSKRFNKIYDTTDINVVISSNNIKHIFNRHGKEKHKGQIDVLPNHLLKYPDVIANPDYIGLNNKLSRGNTPVIYFAKKINGYSVAIEVLSTKKQLYPESYYIFKSSSNEYNNFIINNKLKKVVDMEPNDIISNGINVQNDISETFYDNIIAEKNR